MSSYILKVQPVNTHGNILLALSSSSFECQAQYVDPQCIWNGLLCKIRDMDLFPVYQIFISRFFNICRVYPLANVCFFYLCQILGSFSCMDLYGHYLVQPNDLCISFHSSIIYQNCSSVHPGVSDTYCSFLLLQNVLNYHLSFVPLCQFFIALIEIHAHIHVMCCQQIQSTLIPLQFIFYPHYLCYLQSSFVLFKFLNPTIHLVIFMGKRIGLSCNIRKLSGSTILKKLALTQQAAIYIQKFLIQGWKSLPPMLWFCLALFYADITMHPQLLSVHMCICLAMCRKPNFIGAIHYYQL